MRQTFPKIKTVSGLVLLTAWLTSGMNSVTAQGTTPVCTGPRQGEYLLLVVSPTPDNQNQLRRALPSEINTTVCKYLSDTVTRIGGFTKVDDANGWARYVRDIVGLSAFVTTGDTTGQTPTQTTPQPTRQIPAYNPQPNNQQSAYNPQQLGSGYAVLVDYANRPELVTQIQQIVGGDVGFATYAQRPYLLAVYTTNQREASSTLQTLSDRGFFAMIVDSRKVILLRSSVNL